MSSNKKRSLKPFWILLAISGFPYLFSWIYFANMDNLPQMNPSNRGELIEPVRSIADIQLSKIDGQALDAQTLKGNWVLATVGASHCGEDCQRNVYHITQIRRLMGEERERIKRMFVLLDENNLQDFKQGISSYGDIDIIKAEASDGSRLIAQMQVEGVSPENRVFIIDPLANLIMVYNADADPQDIAKDFKRLLKVVRIGQPKQAG